MHAPRQGGGEAVEEDLHGGGADLGQDEREGVVRAGADGAVEPGRGIAVVDQALGSDAALEPDAGAAAFLANPGLVLAPELDLGLGMGLRDGAQRGGEAPFSKRSCAAVSAFGWLGRVFCQDRLSDFTRRSMPPSL